VSELSGALIDEVSQALTSVVRLTLPAERWPAVGEAVNRIDDAAWAADEAALRTGLKNLRGAVIGTMPRARPGEGAAPAINPLSFRTTDYATRTPLRWIKVILGAAAVLLVTLTVLVMVVLAVGKPSPGVHVAPSPTVSAPPTAPAAEPSGSGGVYLASVGLLVVAGVAAFAIMIWRRRVRTSAPAQRAVPRYASNRVSPPSELVGAVDRAVTVLTARRGAGDDD
jgi:hypothetical protein